MHPYEARERWGAEAFGGLAMDAKTLKAALAAALRVTVSTSLIGCGAHTSTDGAGGGPTSDAREPAMSRPDDGHYPEAEQRGGRPGAEDDYPTASGGVPSSSSAAGSAMDGSASEGGSMMASAAGEGGEGGARRQPLTQCEAAAACLGTLEVMTFAAGEPLPSAAAACCQLVIESLSWRSEGAVCDAETLSALNARFMGSPTRTACCSDPETWQHQACTPWGPAVPPELPREALFAWELAA
jgi:hypothetical protein